MAAKGDVDVAAEQQDVGEHRKPGHEQRQEPEGGPVAVDAAGQAQVEGEGLPERCARDDGAAFSTAEVSPLPWFHGSLRGA